MILKRKIVLLLGIFASLLIQGCAINFNLPANRFDSPEAMGEKGDVNFELAYGGANTVELTSEYGDTAPNTSNPALLRDAYNLKGVVGFGLNEKMDLRIETTNF